jgi:DNA-binding transcriptional MerR regulator
VRLYSPTIIKRLNDIVRAKDVLGLTLQELQEFLSLRELLDNQRTEYRASTNDLIKQEKLQEIIDIINNQLNMIEQKKENMQQVEQELLDLRERGLTLFNKKEMTK